MFKAELRPLMREADLYHTPRPDGTHWDGIEYFDSSRKRGAVYAFHGSDPAEKKHQFALQGLNPTSQYRVIFHDHSSPDTIVLGADLMRRGLTVTLPLPNSSEIVFLHEVVSGTHPASASSDKNG